MPSLSLARWVGVVSGVSWGISSIRSHSKRTLLVGASKIALTSPCRFTPVASLRTPPSLCIVRQPDSAVHHAHAAHPWAPVLHRLPAGCRAWPLVDSRIRLAYNAEAGRCAQACYRREATG